MYTCYDCRSCCHVLPHRVPSRWLMQLIPLLLDPAPSSSSTSGSSSSAAQQQQQQQQQPAAASRMTKIFITVQNAAVDYCPRGIAAQPCRAVVSLRVFRLSANLVPDAATQVCYHLLHMHCSLNCLGWWYLYSYVKLPLCSRAVCICTRSCR
jgi:hypothetical protein